MRTTIHIAANDLDRYFDRQEHKTIALTIACPVCSAAPGDQCLDRWGIPTSLVHGDRHICGYVDPYGMQG